MTTNPTSRRSRFLAVAARHGDKGRWAWRLAGLDIATAIERGELAVTRYATATPHATPDQFDRVWAEAAAAALDTRSAPWALVSIGGEITDVSAGKFLNNLAAAATHPSGRTVIHVDSGGGDLNAAAAMVAGIDRARLAGRRVDAHITDAASAATLIAGACDTITIDPDARMMIHGASCDGPGCASRPANHLAKLNDMIAMAYAHRAAPHAANVQHYRALMAAETVFTAWEAVNLGLADAVRDTPLP